MNVAQILVLGLLWSVNTALECYDCDPSCYGQCINPIYENDRITLCQAEDGEMNMCFSMVYKSEKDDNSTGIYRGCFPVKGTELPCDYLKTKISGGNVTECKMCAENRCNIAQF